MEALQGGISLHFGYLHDWERRSNEAERLQTEPGATERAVALRRVQTVSCVNEESLKPLKVLKANTSPLSGLKVCKMPGRGREAQLPLLCGDAPLTCQAARALFLGGELACGGVRRAAVMQQLESSLGLWRQCRPHVVLEVRGQRGLAPGQHHASGYSGEV